MYGLKAVAIAAAFALAGCATAASTTEINSAAAAGEIYHGLAPLADALVVSNRCDKTCRHAVGSASAEIRKDLDTALADEAAGNSAAAELAYRALETALPNLKAILGQNGVILP
jgi:hypothetical protein